MGNRIPVPCRCCTRARETGSFQDRASLLGRSSRQRPQQQQQRRQRQQQQQQFELQPQQHLRGTADVERNATASNEAPTIQEQHDFLDAAKSCNFSLVRALVLAKPNLINCQPTGRWSALHQAAVRGNLETVRFLLDRGASTTARTRDGRTPLEVAHASVFDVLFTATSTFTSEEGNTAPQVTSDEALESLRLWHFSPSSMADECQCHICLQNFADGEELRALPCNHSFHVDCVDAWLKQKSSSCPTCRADLPAS